jgi:hypothetical protein
VQKLRGAKLGRKIVAPALPEWARAAQAKGERLLLFDDVQVRRRQVWQDMVCVSVWLNSLPKEDRALDKLNLVTYEQAVASALAFAERVHFKPF